jgi:hypothetical protein
MQHAELILSDCAAGAPMAGRCSVCHETFTVKSAAVTDPIAGQRELRGLFDAHVKERHTWRADANQTAALRLREMMKEFGS